MLFKPNPSLEVPIYLQLMEQVKHAIETRALRPGDQLPAIRPLAEALHPDCKVDVSRHGIAESVAMRELFGGRLVAE